MIEVIRLLLIPAKGKSDNVAGLQQYYLCEEELRSVRWEAAEILPLPKAFSLLASPPFLITA